MCTVNMQGKASTTHLLLILATGSKWWEASSAEVFPWQQLQPQQPSSPLLYYKPIRLVSVLFKHSYYFTTCSVAVYKSQRSAPLSFFFFFLLLICYTSYMWTFNKVVPPFVLSNLLFYPNNTRHEHMCLSGCIKFSYIFILKMSVLLSVWETDREGVRESENVIAQRENLIIF